MHVIPIQVSELTEGFVVALRYQKRVPGKDKKYEMVSLSHFAAKTRWTS